MGEEERSQSVLDRALNGLGEKLGVHKEGTEGMKKTAEEVRYSGVASAEDAGDYGTHAEALSAQVKETRAPGASAQAGMAGSQVETVNFATDKSYSLGGMDATTAKAVISILNRATAGLNKKAQDPGAGGQMPGAGGGTAAPAEGPEVGGAPEVDVDAGVQPPGDAGALAAPGMPMGGGATDVIIQEKINELTDEIDEKKEVVRTLTEIAQEAQSAVPMPMTARRNVGPRKTGTKRMTGRFVRRGEKDDQSKKVPHASVDVNSYGEGSEKDKALADQAKGKSTGTPKARMPQEFAESSDRDYVLARKAYRSALLRRAKTLRKHGATRKQAVEALEGSAINRVWNRVEAARRQYRIASKNYLAEIAKLVKGGASYEGARSTLRRSKGAQIEGARRNLKQALAQFRPLLKAAVGAGVGRYDADESGIYRSPSGRVAPVQEPLVEGPRLSSGDLYSKSVDVSGTVSGGARAGGQGKKTKKSVRGRRRKFAQGDQELAPEGKIPTGQHPEYTGEDAGDRGDDLISDGNVDTLVSPETKSVETAADRELGSRHDSDVAGSVTARRTAFSTVEKKKILGVLQSLDATHDRLAQVANFWTKRAMLRGTPGALGSTIASRTASMKSLGDTMQNLLLLSKERRASRKKLRDAMGKAVVAAQAQVREGTELIRLAETLSAEADARNQRLARVSPAFKLALKLYSDGHLDLMELPEKMASFIGMTANEFKKVATVIADLQPVKTGGRNPKTAARLPFVRSSSEDGVDASLAGIFDDD